MPLPSARPLALTVAVGAVVLAVPALALFSPATTPTALADAGAAAPLKPAGKTVQAQILAINDFHGHLEPDDLSISTKTGTSHGSGWVPAGGAAYLEAKIRAARKANPASVVVSAGDLIGASPMISGYYHDEPTVEAMNKILDVGVVGNHEFDEGTAELRRMVKGGCHPVDGCQDHTPYAGTKFDLLAANVVSRRTGAPILPAYVIKNVGGARIGFIGTVTPDTPILVDRAGIKDVKFLPQAGVINALAPKLRAAGADAVVVLTHSGGQQMSPGSVDDCNDTVGEAVDLTKAVAGRVDAVVSAHTHRAYVCSIKGTMLTSAASYGRLMTTLKLTVDTGAHKVTAISASNSVVTHKLTPDPGVAAVVSRYHKLISPIANRKVGHLSRTANRNPSRSGESVLGDVVGDAQLRATKPKAKGGAQLAFVAYGLIRTNLDQGRTTYGQVYAAQPFGQRLVTMTLTARQIDQALETQLCLPGAVHPTTRVPMGVSKSFTYKYDLKGKCRHSVRMRDFRLNGKKMTADGHYRVTVNALFASGENGFTVLRSGTHRVTGALDRDALAGYLGAHPKLKLPHRNRITLR